MSRDSKLYHLPEHLRALGPDVEWGAIVGARNIIVHKYFNLNLRTIWETVQDDLPELRAQVERLLAEEQPDS